VSVRDSVFEGVFSVFVDDLNDSFVEIANNDIATVATAIDLSAGVHKTQTAASRVVIAGNTVRVPVGAQGVVLADMGDAPTLQVWLVGNVFELDGAVAGIGGFAQGVVVRDNLMRGTASAGVRIGALPEDDDEEPPPAATGWMVAANDLSALEAELADIWLTEEAREAVVVCGGSARVLDEGVGSRVICD
jgi:hypothetical protein